MVTAIIPVKTSVYLFSLVLGTSCFSPRYSNICCLVPSETRPFPDKALETVDMDNPKSFAILLIFTFSFNIFSEIPGFISLPL